MIIASSGCPPPGINELPERRTAGGSVARSLRVTAHQHDPAQSGPTNLNMKSKGPRRTSWWSDQDIKLQSTPTQRSLRPEIACIVIYVISKIFFHYSEPSFMNLSLIKCNQNPNILILLSCIGNTIIYLFIYTGGGKPQVTLPNSSALQL